MKTEFIDLYFKILDTKASRGIVTVSLLDISEEISVYVDSEVLLAKIQGVDPIGGYIAYCIGGKMHYINDPDFWGYDIIHKMKEYISGGKYAK